MKLRTPLPWRVAAVFVVALLVGPRPIQAQGFKWWQDESFQRKLGLTADQSRRIEDVFQSALPELRRAKHQLDDLERGLSRFVERPVEDASLVQQVDRVEAARSDLNKARTLMLLRIRRILTADQRVKFETLHRERGRLGSDPRH